MNNGSVAFDIVQTNVPFGCADSDNLLEVEQWIVENVRTISRCRLSICLAFARIKTNKLYKQAGINSFSGYLQAKRVKIHYHTAHDYALIGEIYLKYRDELEMIHFTEHDGLRKLLLLEQGLERANGHATAVFQTFKGSSFREFKRFVHAHCKSGRPDSEDQNKRLRSANNVMLSDECLILMPDGRELLWFDPELDELFESPELVNRFKRCVVNAVKDFFNPNRLHTLNTKPSSSVGF
jgi:hypothetical protein